MLPGAQNREGDCAYGATAFAPRQLENRVLTGRYGLAKIAKFLVRQVTNLIESHVEAAHELRLQNLSSTASILRSIRLSIPFRPRTQAKVEHIKPQPPADVGALGKSIIQSSGQNGIDASIPGGRSMGFLKMKIAHLLADVRGQDLIEYGLLAAFISVVTILVVQAIGLLVVPLYEAIEAVFGP